MTSPINKLMNRVCGRLRSEEGNVLITAFILLVVLTLIGIFATRTAQMDIQIAANEIPYRQNFYLAEAALHREAAELGRGAVEYGVQAIHSPLRIARRGYSLPPVGDIPEPKTEDRHSVFEQTYDFDVWYRGSFPPPPGYSAIHFARYDYNVDVDANRVTVASRLYKIGPRAE